MAVLGQIRQRSVFLILVIGMALFAFVIAGVFDGSGFQSQEPVGKINGEELSITDFRNQLDVLKKSEIILAVNCLADNESNIIKNNSILIGQFDPSLNKDFINNLIKKNIKIFSLNLLPRITRAQSMDVLSSQANLAGYKAVVESFSSSNFLSFQNRP